MRRVALFDGHSMTWCVAVFGTREKAEAKIVDLSVGLAERSARVLGAIMSHHVKEEEVL